MLAIRFFTQDPEIASEAAQRTYGRLLKIRRSVADTAGLVHNLADKGWFADFVAWCRVNRDSVFGRYYDLLGNEKTVQRWEHFLFRESETCVRSTGFRTWRVIGTLWNGSGPATLEFGDQ